MASDWNVKYTYPYEWRKYFTATGTATFEWKVEHEIRFKQAQEKAREELLLREELEALDQEEGIQ